MTSQRKLGELFAVGEQSGSASNVQIVETKTGSAIVGYGYAVYFERQGGTIVRYDGWRGYSVSTSCQLTKLSDGILRNLRGSIESSDEQKKIGELEL